MKLLIAKMFCIVFISSALCAFAPSVVVQMAQHDTEREALRESTFILENGVLNVLFDAGYIVSSLPTAINTDIDANLKESIKLAKEGYMSYVVYINVYYHTYEGVYDETITVEDIDAIDWKIVKTSDMSVFSEGKASNVAKLEGESDYVAMQRFSNDLGSRIQEDFNKKL